MAATRKTEKRPKPPKGPPGWKVRLAARVRAELAALCLGILCVFVLLALASYAPTDPSFNSAVDASPRNLGGVVGAYSAEALFTWLGYAAYLLPLALGVYALRYAVLRPISYPGWVACGYAVLVLAAGGLLELVFPGGLRFGGELRPAGGAVGLLLGQGLARYFNRPGAALLLGAGFLAALMFTVNFSVFSSGERVGRWLRGLWGSCTGALGRWRERRAARRKEADGGKPRRPVRGDGPSPVAAAAPRNDIQILERPRTPVQEPLPGLAPEIDGFRLPSLTLLDPGAPTGHGPDPESLRMQSRILAKKLQDFRVSGEVGTVRPGPVITMFEFKPAPGVKINSIAGLADDLAMALGAMSVRIVAPIPGRDVVGIEIPNSVREVVNLREVLSSPEYRDSKSKLTLALGKDIAGRPYVTDLARMPHLLVAGATGSGKSVGVHAMLASLLFRATPADVRLLIVDPKMLELSVYNDIPHLLLPVVTDAKKAAVALRWAVQEMERRYRLMAEEEVRNITTYNRKIEARAKALRGRPARDDENLERLPFVVVVIDELADLMMVASKDVEESIARLAQMARAAGLHLILATQRPSVDVITGLIKANFPARIAFQVASRVDSRTILDSGGAEALLGGGDMLVLPPTTAKLDRVHGSFVSEEEIARLARFLREQGDPAYDESILEEPEGPAFDDPEFDELYDKAVQIVAETRQASISMIQRRLKIGYNRAARMVERMEQEGVVGPSRGAKPREVLVNPL